MWRGIGIFLAVLLVILGGAILLAMLFLGLGSLLTRLFAVSVWEATTVVFACIAFLVWLVTSLVGLWPRPPGVEPAAWPGDEDDEEDSEPAIYITDLPIPPLRRRKRRQR